MTVTDIELLFAVPFDYPVFVEPDVVGSSIAIQLASGPARIELPRPRDPAGNRGLVQPASAPDDFAEYLPEKIWGIADEQMPYVDAWVVLIVVPVHARIDFELSATQVGGAGVQTVLDEVRTWFDSFARWLWALTAQAIDPMNPDPKVLHRKSNNLLMAARAADKTSLAVSASPRMAIFLDLGSPASERVVNRAALDWATSHAGAAPVPLAVEMLASARMAARRGDRRRSLIDSGIAAEAALTQLLNLPANHRSTLGGLVTMAQGAGVTIAQDASTALVQPRNDAAHRGQVAPKVNVMRALEIVDELVAQVEPTLPRAPTMRSVNRGQRHDLHIIVPPKPKSTDGGDPPT